MMFAGRTVLVTGASRGLGAAVARAFAAEGALVAVNYLGNHAAAQNVVEACRAAGGEAFAIPADVTDPDAVSSMMEKIHAEAGRLDAVVNNAFRPFRFDPDNRARFPDVDWADYQAQFDGAVRGAYNVCRAAVPLMKDRARGAIVNIASDLVLRPTIPYHDYTTAKSALVGFSRNLAAELGAFGVRVNCVAPGLIYPTDASRATPEPVKQALIAATPLGRIAGVGDVTGPVLFLASDWSEFVTGQVLVVDGGLVMA